MISPSSATPPHASHRKPGAPRSSTGRPAGLGTNLPRVDYLQAIKCQGDLELVAPEICDGRAPDPRADVFGLAALYQRVLKSACEQEHTTPQSVSLDADRMAGAPWRCHRGTKTIGPSRLPGRWDSPRLRTDELRYRGSGGSTIFALYCAASFANVEAHTSSMARSSGSTGLRMSRSRSTRSSDPPP